MIKPEYLGSIYVWPPFLVALLIFVGYVQHYINRLSSKSRKHPDKTLEKKAKIMKKACLGMIALFLLLLLLIDWNNPTNSMVMWAACYAMPTLFLIQAFRGIQKSEEIYYKVTKNNT